MSDSDNDRAGAGNKIDDELAKAMRRSKLEAKKSPPKPEEYFDDEHMRQAYEMSHQESHASSSKCVGEFDEEEIRRVLELSGQAESQPAVAANPDGDFERMLAESAKEYEAYQQRQSEAAEGQAKEEEILKESARLAAEHKAATKERRKKEDEEYKQRLKTMKEDNKVEWMIKSQQRKKFSEYQIRREREIAEEEAKEARLQREAQQRQRELALRPNVDDDDPEYQRILREVQAESLGGAPAEDTVGEVADEDVPKYRKAKDSTEKKPQWTKYTTTSRDPSKAGSICAITDAIRKEFNEKAIAMAQMKSQSIEDPNDKFPKYYKKAIDDPYSNVGHAAGKKIPASEPPKPKPAWDMAKAVHGGNRKEILTAVEAEIVGRGREMPKDYIQGFSKKEVAKVNGGTAAPWMTRFAGVQTKINQGRKRSKPRDRT